MRLAYSIFAKATAKSIKSSMTTWATYRLGDAAIFNPPERLAKGTIAPKVAMEQLQPFTRAVSGYEKVAYSGGSKFRNGDTLMARITPCLENGKTAYVSLLDDDEVGFGSTEYIVLRNIEGVTDDKFLYYFVTNPWFRNIAIKSMVGSSGRQRVQQSVLENLEVSLPPLAEQKRIAGILGALDDKIELNRRINANLEEQAMAFFKQWFVSAATSMWTTKCLGNFFNVITGKKDANYSTSNGIYPFYTCSQDILKAPDYSFDGAAILLAGNGDFNVKRYVGKFEAYQRTYVLIPFEQKYHAYLYLLIKYYLPKITGGSRGSVIKFITKGNIANFEFSFPNIEDDDKFLMLNNWYRNIDRNNVESVRLSALRDALLPKLMRGEIVVK